MEADRCQSNPSTWCCLATLASSGQFSPQTSNHLISTPTTPSRQTTSFPISQITQKQLGENYLQLPATNVKFSELMFTFSSSSPLWWKPPPSSLERQIRHLGCGSFGLSFYRLKQQASDPGGPILQVSPSSLQPNFLSCLDSFHFHTPTRS